jgi:hypothetical protein
MLLATGGEQQLVIVTLSEHVAEVNQLEEVGATLLCTGRLRCEQGGATAVRTKQKQDH